MLIIHPDIRFSRFQHHKPDTVITREEERERESVDFSMSAVKDYTSQSEIFASRAARDNSRATRIRL